jgi:hypothetical protein
MTPDVETPNGPRRAPKRSLGVEAVVVGSILVSLSSTFVAVVLFLNAGARRDLLKSPPKPAPAPTVVETPKEPVAPPVAAPFEPQPPDTSLEELKRIESRIAEARTAKARADLMAWTAEKAADWLKTRSLRTTQAAKEAQTAREVTLRRAERIQAEAAALADRIAHLELKRDDASAKLEAARNRKGFSILPYRGPNGAWQRPLPIECARDIAQIMPGGPTFRLIDLELSGMSRNSLFARIVEMAVRKAASQATPDGDAPTIYVLFVVRPSGIKAYYEARARLQAQGVAFGYELIDETTPIDYPDLGDLTEWPGYVPPQELAEAVGTDAADATSPALGGGGRRGIGGIAGEGSGSGTSEKGDGLFVWREGLEGKSPMPGGTDAAARGIGSTATGKAGEGNGIANGGAGTINGEAPGDGTPSPRVNFGPGTLSQLGRSRSGGGEADFGAAAERGRSPGAIAGGSRLTVPSLEPPWGSRPDPRRNGSPGEGIGGAAGNGSRESAGSSDVTGKKGTFEDLVAELAAQGDLAPPRSLTRPGAVPIRPGDLEDSTDSRSSTGMGGLAGGGSTENSAEPSQTVSPFGTPRPTLPKFEPVPTGTDPAGSGTGAPASPSAVAASAANSARSPASSGSPSSPSAGSPGSASSSGQPGGAPRPEPPKQGLRNSIRRIFGGEERLPEKTWEVSLTCDADGMTIRPGEHRLSLNDLQTDPDLLPRTLQSMFERHVRENPERYWRPYVKYRLAAGGEGLMGLSQQQLAQGFVRWPAVVEPATANAAATGVTR